MGRREFLAALAALQGDRPSPGLVYVGALPSQVLVFDEDQEKVVDRIPLHTGVPRRLRLSYDKKKFYVTTPLKNGIEVVDLASRKVVNHFVLNEADRRVQLAGFAPDPRDQILYGEIRVAIKRLDRFEIEKPKLAVIDLAQQKIVRTADVPLIDGRPAPLGGFRVSPDGKYLYSFARDVRIFDTADFKLVETIEVSKPLYPGMARLGFGPQDDPDEEPEAVTGVFNSTDPVVRRTVFGIARFDLNRRTFEFTPVGPAAGGMMGLRLAPDRKTGYTVAFQGDIGNRRCEFWVFDMATRKVVRRVEFDGPVNFNFTLSGDGKRIYLGGTAPVLEIYDAATLGRRRSVDMNADMTGGLLVGPRRALAEPRP